MTPMASVAYQRTAIRVASSLFARIAPLNTVVLHGKAGLQSDKVKVMAKEMVNCVSVAKLGANYLYNVLPTSEALTVCLVCNFLRRSCS